MKFICEWRERQPGAASQSTTFNSNQIKSNWFDGMNVLFDERSKQPSASADSANQQSQTNSFNQIKNLMKVGWRWLASFTFIIKKRKTFFSSCSLSFVFFLFFAQSFSLASRLWACRLFSQRKGSKVCFMKEESELMVWLKERRDESWLEWKLITHYRGDWLRQQSEQSTN